MPSLPEKIETASQLDELLSRPSPGLIDRMAKLDGDILIFGAGGKMGPTLARMAKRAVDEAGVKKAVIGVARRPLEGFEEHGIETLQCDLSNLDAVKALPQVENVVYMAGRKFGSTGSEHLTWGANVIIPYHVASTFTQSRVAMFSTGCVYPLADLTTAGCKETDSPDPIGEYAQSCLGRERIFDYFSHEAGERVVHIRLFYAVEMRYGVLVDVGRKVWAGEPVDLTTGHANVIWQGDASDHILQSLDLASTPPAILNVTGPAVSIKDVAESFGRLMGKDVRFSGESNGIGYLGDPAEAIRRFGELTVSADEMIRWIAHWIQVDGESLGKPTHFEAQDGKY